ncbi:MAG TPA: hypothetical protein VK856_08095 [Anaerolineaceae bacterium]|nr:hypothetical protein [Anaerolineaceae bacterium]
MNQKSHFIKNLFPVFVIITIISIACQLPTGLSQEKSPESDLEATIAVLQTKVNEQGEVVEPSDVPTPSQTDETPPQDSPVQDETSLYQGFYVLQNNWFSPFDFSGNSLGDGYPAGINNWYGENDVESFQDEIFYTEFLGGPTSVYRVDAQGTTTLDFISSQDSISITVSPDRQLIAWATNRWEAEEMQNEIFYANLDGTNVQLIDSIPGSELLNFPRLIYPIRWTEQGRLLYATGLTGIGGYMLFWGYNGLFLYDPLDNSTRTLVNDDEQLGICLSSVSDDLEMISIVCGGENNVRVRSLTTGIETVFPKVQDQVMAGAARFSPSGEWLAYVVQRADPMQELGKVVLVPVDGSQLPRILATVDDGSFIVEGWMSENDIIVTQSNLSTNHNTVLRIARDGSQVSQIATGTFIDFIP